MVLIVRRTHESELHLGVHQTLAALRTRYWVIRGRQAVKKCIRACIICRRQDGRPFCPLMSELPVKKSGGIVLRRAVTCTGRGSRYMITMHLEIIADMTTTNIQTGGRVHPLAFCQQACGEVSERVGLQVYTVEIHQLSSKYGRCSSYCNEL
ncbi:hypothetical protein T07_13439 [Trichinella nelsoni]|uniref:Integrase zinc-binding domain-containing protein n=1 Tax=Trichinella nelsoni TaxID=6336 RepID=A0A0V0RF36_9BILA|nr:hypothetical protein T07_13439 [Trichinella nelsoni]